MKLLDKLLCSSLMSFTAGCAGGMEPLVEAEQQDPRLVAQWTCELFQGESRQGAIATWLETLEPDGKMRGKGAVNIGSSQAPLQILFNGTGQWATSAGAYIIHMEDVEFYVEGDPQVVAQIDREQIRRELLASSSEQYEWSKGVWTRRKSDSTDVVVCKAGLVA